MEGDEKKTASNTPEGYCIRYAFQFQQHSSLEILLDAL